MTQLVKAWIWRHYHCLLHSKTPEVDLLEACGHITGDMAKAWFGHSGYN
jgi:hypothetical protein